MRYDYITSDLHFWHKNICVYCDRPYTGETIQKMNEDLLDCFDRLPAGSSILYLGDFILSSGRTFEDVKSIVDSIKAGGKKISIVLGNHDRNLGRYLKDKQYRRMPAMRLFAELGFDEVFGEPIEIDGIAFSHEPMFGLPEPLHKNVHGHTHDKDVDESYFNRACDNWAMMEVVKEHPELTKQKIDIDTSVVTDAKTCEPGDYINVCWDKWHRILSFTEVLELAK